MAFQSKRIGFIGAGNMCKALAKGIIKNGIPPSNILASDKFPAALVSFKRVIGANVTSDSATVIQESDIIIFSVKPQNMPEVLAGLKRLGPWVLESKLFVTICAGVPSHVIERGLGCKVRVIRAMPNTPMLAGEGAVALCKGQFASERELDLAVKIFERAAKVVKLKEAMLDAVTAISGSGPAYFFYLVETMISAGESIGLPRDVAEKLSKQTAYGSGKLMMESKETPTKLRQRVTSKGGTTHAAITTFDKYQMRDIITAAIENADFRSKELGKEWDVPSMKSKL